MRPQATLSKAIISNIPFSEHGDPSHPQSEMLNSSKSLVKILSIFRRDHSTLTLRTRRTNLTIQRTILQYESTLDSNTLNCWSY